MIMFKRMRNHFISQVLVAVPRQSVTHNFEDRPLEPCRVTFRKIGKKKDGNSKVINLRFAEFQPCFT